MFHRGRFITTTFQTPFGKFKSPICAEFCVALFFDFSHQREVQLGAPLAQTKYLTNRCLILYSLIPSRNVLVDEQVISLRTRSSFPLSIVCALYIIYFIIPTDARNLLRRGKVVVAF